MSSVVGVAVIGAGRAGRARLRALDGHPGARVAGVVRRGEPPTFEEVLGDEAVDAVLVCTPNYLHADMAEAALAAGKHVAVEFPLALDTARAAALFAQARASDRILHVEHIELLSRAQAAQRRRLAELGTPRGGELRFEAGSDGWIGDPVRAGSPALRALARLHRLVDLFGSARVTESRLETAADGYRLEVGLAFERGGETRLVERRGSGLPRGTHWSIECEHGRLDDPPERPVAGLFRRDLDVFLDRIATGGPSYVSEERVLEVLELVGEIERCCAHDR